MARKIRGSDHTYHLVVKLFSISSSDFNKTSIKRWKKIRFDGQLSKPSLEERVKKRNPKGLWFGYRRLLLRRGGGRVVPKKVKNIESGRN
jgi:hypothetical protein